MQDNPFLLHLQNYNQIVARYEDSELLERALEHIPIYRLYEEASEAAGDEEAEGILEQHVIRKLLRWFKHEFFTWVDQPPCDYCTSKTVGVGSSLPNREELRFGASVVELYQCTVCNLLTRFPRYNDPAKLLETRRGRCGEWANCFTLCCRAIGVEARLILDSTDHVWTEIYSESEQRWIHCDSCEEAYDRPLLYSVGWGKQLAYCIALSAEEAVDVTNRYIRNIPEVLKRRVMVSEAQLAEFLNLTTLAKQLDLPSERVAILTERREKEIVELIVASLGTEATDEEKVGRQSGSLAWRKQRGEYKPEENAMHNTLQTCKQELTDLQTKPPLASHVKLLGTATSLPCAESQEVIRLTESKPSQCGGVYLKQQWDWGDHQVKGLECQFSFKITNEAGAAAWGGADGLAFVIQAEGIDVLGEGGCELGYGGIKKSLAVEFDTYNSSDRCHDPSGNHISVHGRLPPHANSAHHRYSLGHTSSIPPMNSGEWIHVRIRFLTAEETLEVAISEDSQKPSDVSQETYIPALTVCGINMTAYMGDQTKAWVGLTASTGGISQNHDVYWRSLAVYKSDA